MNRYCFTDKAQTTNGPGGRRKMHIFLYLDTNESQKLSTMVSGGIMSIKKEREWKREILNGQLGKGLSLDREIFIW